MSKEDIQQEFEKKLKKERLEELEKIGKGKLDLSKFEEVKESLGDKAVAKQSDFKKKDEKQSGVSAGYIANSDTGKTFILKHFYKNHDDCLSKVPPQEQTGIQIKEQEQAINDRADGVRELIGSAMYQFLLYDRAPKEGLVTPDEKDPKSLYVRSKFFEDAMTAEMVSYGGLKNVEGFAKLVASCHILGELDYHKNNIMVQTQKGKDGEKDRKIFTKIDHGRSLMAFNQDFASMVGKTNDTFKSFGYDADIKNGNLSFNIDEFSEALNQMTSQFGPDQIDAIVDQKIDELKKAGFNPNGLELLCWFDEGLSKYTKTINSFGDLSSFYKDTLKKNLSNMQEIAKQVEIITKFSGVNSAFKNGGWLQEFAKSEIKDPVAYAAYYDIKIEGKDALSWAKDNNYKIKVNTDKQQKTEVQEKKWQKGENGKWQEFDVTVSTTQDTVDHIEPLEYIKNINYGAAYSKSGRDLEKAMQDAPQPSVKAQEQPKDKPRPESKLRLEKFLVSSIDSFVQGLQDNKNDKTNVRVAKFYDQILDTLKNENYITDEVIKNIKTPWKDGEISIFDEEVNRLSTLIDFNTPKIEGLDKVSYGVANLCKKIGCNSISNYFMKKISSKTLTKIHNIEKALNPNNGLRSS